MSIKSELMASKKLTASFAAALARLPDNTNPDTPLFSAFIRTPANRQDHRVELEQLNGFSFSAAVGDILTVRDVTLNGLKQLVDSSSVESIEGGRPLRPICK